MWKIWLSIGIGVAVAAITVFMGIISQARFTVILYRAVTSIILIGGGSFLIAALSEKFLLPYLMQQSVSSAEALGAQSENGGEFTRESAEELSGGEESRAEFSPFTAENLNRVSPPNS